MPNNRMSTTRPQLYRYSFIDKAIKSGCFPNSRRLSEDLEVSRRTILRDVEFMRDSLHAPLEYCPKNRGYYYTEAGYSLGLIEFTEGEILALYLGHSILTKCKGTPYEKPVVSAFKKICFQLQETVNIDFGQISDFISFDLEPLRGEEEKIASHFATISQAIQKRITIKIKHYAITRDTYHERLVDPYQIRYYQGAWYFVGFCHLREAIRTFALDRIQELWTTNRQFGMVKEFSPDKYFEDSFQMFKGPEIHQVKIWFSPQKARWIKERSWHHTQEVEENSDGSLIYSIKTSGLSQVKRWVLSFGADAKVLEPLELVSAISGKLKAAVSLYSGK